ncbi:type I secretion outer membrane protein, TolC family [Burkholderiales bacterium JOSHI_001]|nr:type I secretion outer membrane protein, TolC family [Burkholderiales bacterium JOSHI_001]
MRKQILSKMALAVALVVGGPLLVQAQDAADLASAVRRALDTNPEISARLNALRGSVDAIAVAKGGRLPKVDLEAEVGATNDRITTRTKPVNIPSPNETLKRGGIALSASQLLWDGMGLQRDIDRLDHERMARWFDLNQASDDLALEVARAWIDVQRMRRLVELAEDSYVQHRYAFEQIQSRVRAGVGRGVDQEQAAARLALAESNLTTEKSNLHDVSERYLRLVGDKPPARMRRIASLERAVPGTATDAMNGAARSSAQVSAAIENLRAARSTAAQRESAWQPRVEARARVGGGKNFDGVEDQKRDANIGLYLNWNLYNGGADQARIRQQANVVNQAADLRDKACRDVRQTASIAYNDVRKLAEQMVLLDRNTLAIEKARDAYRQQFDIGQRSLLDLLNAENELYTARRAFANADYDHNLAQARVLASSGRLISELGLRPADSTELAPDAAKWTVGDDAAARCPLAAMEVTSASRADLDARAKSLLAATPAPVTTQSVAAPAAARAEPPKPAPAPAPVAAVPTTDLEQRLRDWAAAWSAKDVDQYLGFYASSFKPAKGSRSAWESQRRRLVGKPGPISVGVDNIDVRNQPDGSVATSFVQNYSSTGMKDKSRKVLQWRQVGGQWQIVKESNR